MNTGAVPERSRTIPWNCKGWPEVAKRHATIIRRLDDAVGDLLRLLDQHRRDSEGMIHIPDFLPIRHQATRERSAWKQAFIGSISKRIIGGVRMPEVSSPFAAFAMLKF